MDNLQVLKEVIERCIVKLLAIVSDDHSRQAELINDRLSNKIISFFFNDPSQQFYLHLFTEVVDDDDEELLLPGGQQEQAKNVDPPLSDGQGELTGVGGIDS